MLELQIQGPYNDLSEILEVESNNLDFDKPSGDSDHSKVCEPLF